MSLLTRRSFNANILGSLVAYSLIETLFHGDLFADGIRPVINQWMIDLNSLGQDLKGHKLTDLEFQVKMEELYRKVNLPDLLKLVQFDKLEKSARFPDKGAQSLGFDTSKVEGMPSRPVFGKQIFAMKQGRSVVPHGHDNMCTGFIILKGDFAGKHYDRIEDNPDHYLIKPTIDRKFKPGECSTISDHKDNVHWFKADSPTGFIFNIHVMGYDPTNPKNSGRIYVDPEGPKSAGGLIVAKKMSSSECHKKYG
jgi:hypothetical protein